jgi:spore germination cell wall hydrolase CwlJ-like protein
VRWICATAAPWALASGLLVSFTAAAGNDPQSGVSLAERSAAGRLIEPTNLIPPVMVPRSEAANRPGLQSVRFILHAALRFDASDESELSPGRLSPRPDLKAAAPPYPEVDRSHKGDPSAAVLPSLSRRAGDVRQALNSPASRLIFGRNGRLLPPTILMPGKVEGPDLEEQGFEPWQPPDLTTTQQATSVQSPAAAAAGSTGAAAGARTPGVSRATALSSTTPAPADATPIEIAAAPVSIPHAPGLDREARPDTTVATKIDPERPRYVDLINPENLNKEQRCLAEAIYFEARSESDEGQAAVAQVVLNRVKSGLYPASICGVVYQNQHRHLACQFTFACEGKALRIADRDSWATARRIADEVLEGKTYLSDVGGATHYHADYVRPYWARRLKRMDVIGRHIFYKLRPGQT